MPGPHPAVAATRVALRAALRDTDTRVLAAVSGGADSLALAAALAFECDPARPGASPVVAGAVVVDHGLQDGSGEVARAAAETCRALGLETEVVRVDVDPAAPGGPEARARDARYAALEAVATRWRADAVMLGHTRDDQAEQVLLGLARGSGTRSLSGMPAERGLLRRPFLHITRATTRDACVAQGLDVWGDPHNADPRFLRVRARHLLTSVEAEVPGVTAALARSADLLRDDADALDHLTEMAATALGTPPWAVADLAPHPVAIRRRLWRRAALDSGVPAADLTATHLGAIDGLVSRWRGQGPIDLPGGVRAWRSVDPPRLHVGRPVPSSPVRGDRAGTPVGPRDGGDVR